MESPDRQCSPYVSSRTRAGEPTHSRSAADDGRFQSRCFPPASVSCSAPRRRVEEAFLVRIQSLRRRAARADRRPRRRRPPAPVPAAPDRRTRPASSTSASPRSASSGSGSAAQARAVSAAGRSRRSPSARTSPRSRAAATGYFAPVAHTPGFAEAARRLCASFDRRRSTPDDARRARAGALRVGRRRPTTLSTSTARYLDGRAGYYDGDDALAVADPERFDGVELLVVGHLAAQRARPPARRTDRRARAGHRLPARRRRRRRRGARASSATGSIAARRDASSELAAPRQRHRARDVPGDASSRPAARSPPTARSSSSRRPTRSTETSEAARACLAWARAGHPVPRDGRHLPAGRVYRPLVEAVFAEAGIPVYLDDGPSLAERPLGRRILALLDLVDSPLRRPRRDGFLSDGRMPKETRERFGGAPAARWDSASRRAGVVAGHRPVAAAARPRSERREREAAAEEGRARVARAARRGLRLASRLRRGSGARPRAPPGARIVERSLAYLAALLETYVDGAERRARLPRPARAARRARPRGRLRPVPRGRAGRGRRRSRPATSTRASRARSAAAA